MSWERCWLRLSIATWKTVLPESGSVSPRFVVSVVASRSHQVARKRDCGVHGRPIRWSTSAGARSGKASVLPAASNASWATTPAAWCWPWPARGVPGKTETITWGRKRRITRTASSSRIGSGHFSKVSSSERV